MENDRTESFLITGGSGFIGTWVLRELIARGHSAIAYDLKPATERWNRILGGNSSKITFISGDLCDRESLERVVSERAVTRIIHLAALLTPDCQRDPYAGCEVNVLGSVAILELARKHAAQIRGLSYASSYAVYGPEADDVASESEVKGNRPPLLYGAFKMAVDMIAEQYWRHFQVASVGIRPHVAYGPERTVGLTAAPSQAAKAAALGEGYCINYTGVVGYDYVEDVAKAFVEGALRTPPGSTVVDLPSQLASTQEFADVIQRVVPQSIGKITVDGPAIPSNVPPIPNYISSIFTDWKPTTLEEGVRRTVEFYRKTLQAIV